MKRKFQVQTYDGNLHDSVQDAKKYLDAKYADILLRIAREVIQLKYSDAAGYLDGHLNDFQLLLQIRNDMVWMGEEDDE